MKSNVKTAVRIALLSGCIVAATSATAYDKELLDILLENDSITQVQYDKLIKKETITKDDVIVKLDKKGLQFATADKQFEMKVGARLHVDAIADGGNNKHAKTKSGTEVRRARIYLKGKVWNDFKYNNEVAFAEALKSPSDFACMSAETNIASVPVPSSGA